MMSRSAHSTTLRKLRRTCWLMMLAVLCVVQEVVTEDTTVGSNHFKASEDNPKVKVKSQKSGKEAVHKPTSVHKV
ncbi:hypothetical protein COO60DRAFT_1540412 [Scenedesmus sp. NREL 46B-D3]|nr:hypothetical protein COO60DRAFT_1540412 [Scenedesmus sp. NREL 46B-D3]